MKNRRGASLVELMTTMMCCAVILGLSSSLIQAVIRSERLGTSHLTHGTTLDRVSHQFRRDVRAAKNFNFADVANEQGLHLNTSLSADHRVEYLLDSNSVIRTEWNGDKTVVRETFRLPIENGSRIVAEQRDGLPLLSLVLVLRPGKGSREESREFRVEAIQGKDNRFAVSVEQ